MNSHTTPEFREMLAALPKSVRQQARQAYRLFAQNPSHPGLQFKQLYRDPPIYSARVGLYYRAVGTLQGDTITWYWIGSHGDYDKLF